MQGYKAATLGGTAGAKSAPRATNAPAASNGSGSGAASANTNGAGASANKKTNAKKKPAATDKTKTANGNGTAAGDNNGAARSAPPPGFAPAAKAAAPAPTGFSDSQQRLLRHRALFAFRFLVGKAVEVTLVDASSYVGVLDCIDPDDFSLVVKNTQLKGGDGANGEAFDSGSTVIFKRQQIAHISAEGIVNYTEGPAVAAATAGAPGFRTDTEISGRSHEHLFGRELQSAASWLDPQLDSGELEDPRRRASGKGAWNQFEVNEKLFGVVSSFDENLYTTKLDKTKISNEKSREAERLAREIERETTGNFHLQEERGQAVHGGDDLDEEAKYSSVDRKDQNAQARNPNAYVPPALRNASRPGSASAAPSKVISPKVATPAAASAPAPATEAAPAPTSVDPPAAPLAAPTQARKPISFSEAVTGRPAARPSPTLAPASTPSAAANKTAPTKTEQKATASPKKQPSPKTDKSHASVAKATSSPTTKKDTKSTTKSTDKKATTTSQPSEKKPADAKPEEVKAEKKTAPTKTTEPVAAAAAAAPAAKTAPGTPLKKTLNPNAKEFKLSAKAVEFTPKFATPPAAPVAVSSPYRQPAAGHYGHMHPPPPHPMAAMGYQPPPEEWMYDGGMMLDETEYAAAAAHAYMGYGMPMMPNAAMMQQPMYPPMMTPQQNVRMGRGGGGAPGGYGYSQPGMYNQRGYYGQGAVPGAMPYHPAAAGAVPGVPQPPLPREPSPADASGASGPSTEVPASPSLVSSEPPANSTGGPTPSKK